MTNRRRILTGLSAAGVAAVLPTFAFGGVARAEEFELQARLRERSMTPEGLEFHLMLRSSQTVTLRQVIRVRAYVDYPDERGVLDVQVRGPGRPAGWIRRGPPPLPMITLEHGQEVRFGTFYVSPRQPRGIVGIARFEISVEGRRLPVQDVNLLA